MRKNSSKQISRDVFRVHKTQLIKSHVRGGANAERKKNITGMKQDGGIIQKTGNTKAKKKLTYMYTYPERHHYAVARRRSPVPVKSWRPNHKGTELFRFPLCSLCPVTGQLHPKGNHVTSNTPFCPRVLPKSPVVTARRCSKQILD